MASEQVRRELAFAKRMRKSTTRKRIKYGGPRVDSFVGLRPQNRARLSLLADATGRLAKAERLVKKWRKQAAAANCERCPGGQRNRLLLCAENLERLLKP